MESRDVLISPVGVEDPLCHILAINDELFNVAIELQSIILMGASIKSTHSEYRNISVNARAMKAVIAGNSANKPVNKCFKRLKAIIDKEGVLSYEKNTIKAITKQGFDYALAYYLILRKADYHDGYYDNLNCAPAVVALRAVFDKVLAKAKLTAIEMKEFDAYVGTFDNLKCRVGSKLIYITNRQIHDTSNLSFPVWKTLYIQKILRGISKSKRKHLFLPLIDWGIMRGPMKQLFSNSKIMDTLAFGDHIRYIRTTGATQSRLLKTVIDDDTQLLKIKKLTQELEEASANIDYALTDVAMLRFYPNVGVSLYDAIHEYIDTIKDGHRPAHTPIISSVFDNHGMFKKLVFQYLYSVFLLASNGIIHNDPHFHNILISKASSSTRVVKYEMSDTQIIEMAPIDADLSVIDFNNSILSHDHRGDFANEVPKIAKEMNIVFAASKKTIHNDPNQIFSCYVMYDVIKFCLIMKQMIAEVSSSIGKLAPKSALSQHNEFLDSILKFSINVLSKLFDDKAKFSYDISQDRAGSIRELITTIYKSSLKNAEHRKPETPELISARRKYTESLRYAFISQCASKAF